VHIANSEKVALELSAVGRLDLVVQKREKLVLCQVSFEIQWILLFIILRLKTRTKATEPTTNKTKKQKQQKQKQKQKQQ
jgi:hypothetical protein